MFTELITLKDTNAFIKRIYVNGNYLLGTFEIGDDGYWYYCFPSIGTGGLVHAGLLKAVAEKLEELNEPYDRLVAQQLQKSRQPLEADDLVPLWAWD